MNREQGLWNRDFVAVCFSSFFLFMTFYILAVTLPIFVTDSLMGGQEQIGLVMTVFVIAAVIFRPLAGKWIDEFNKRKIIILSLALFMGCTAVYALVDHFYALLVLRFLHGIGFGMAATATGAIAIGLVPDHRKGEGIGYFSLFMSLAMVIGPFLGLTVMEHFNDAVLFGFCVVLALLSFICGIMVRIPEQEERKKTERATGWRKFIEPEALPISLAGSILAFSYGAITTFISVYAIDMGMGSYASYFFMIFAAMIVVSRPFTGKIFDRLGPHVLVYPGIVLFSLGMIGLSLAQTPLVFLMTGGIIGLGFGALLPSFQTIAVQSAPNHRRGVATGTYFVLFDTGYGLGAYLLGIVAASTSYHTMYFIAGLVVACTAVIYYGLHHRKVNLMKSGSTVNKKAI
ncbi:MULTISPECIES: MFS transporter [unclassified Paenibacillus]|uniref:MFS transporter n=1 Tax=unclassified Paenibacillus TaxID=185978 RepID=UPI001B6922CB|nr:MULTISPECIES: MFS transporter [unclassified Paenibacillus]MBP1153322.1 MFS family permease [Paenibacillus sp. PvP091]MBP1171295.1 MFS family permease [Paenibacillus sp. PvR098]MBP2442323.1 MFS family permease [Paenibacillus sp. PvP052]